MKKLKIPRNLTQLAYDSIRNCVLTGRVDEESRLTEESLSKRLGISKSPIREALTRLETEGLIKIEPRRGAYLRNFSAKEIDELYDIREALEVHAVGAVNVTPALIRKLEESVDRMRDFRERGDKAGYVGEDISFHASLARSTGNDRLLNILENIQTLILLSRRNTYDMSSSEAPACHDAIVAALKRRDLDKARLLMGNHIRRVRTALMHDLDANDGHVAHYVASAEAEQSERGQHPEGVHWIRETLAEIVL
jgi:DNA-binding GntR family transcriptional regulator